MAEVEWTIELSHRAENNIDKILLYISQNSSLQKAFIINIVLYMS
jgi:hypothetical protein